MRPEIQEKVTALWNKINDDNLDECADIAGYQHDFCEIFGFDAADVDYDADVDTAVGIRSISE